MSMPEPGRTYSLDGAIAGALAANRSTRIEWRDQIAQHGPLAIDAVFEWAADHDLGLFAVRVMEAVGKRGYAADALDAMASLAAIGASGDVRREAQAATQRLRPDAPKHASFKLRTKVPEHAGVDWPGFEQSDFGQIAGTTWRMSADRRGLIPLLLRPLQDRDPDMKSYAIYPLPEVHVANRDRYEQTGERKQGWRASKLVVYAHGQKGSVGPHVAVGYYVEKGTGADEFGRVDRALWDWPRFLDLLRDSERRPILEAAFANHDLQVGDYTGGRFGQDGAAVHFVGRLEDGELAIRFDDGRMERGWEALVAALETLPDGVWHDLHVWRQWSATEAIAAGHAFAVSTILPVLTDLARIYQSVIGHPKPPAV